MAPAAASARSRSAARQGVERRTWLGAEREQPAWLAGGGEAPAEGSVEGSVEGRTIRCASAEDQLLMHQGYEPRPVDVLDVRRIAARFGLPGPAFGTSGTDPSPLG